MFQIPRRLVNGEDLPTTEEFRRDGGAGSDIRNRLNKASNAFIMLNNVWKSSHITTQPEISGRDSCYPIRQKGTIYSTNLGRLHLKWSRFEKSEAFHGERTEH